MWSVFILLYTRKERYMEGGEWVRELFLKGVKIENHVFFEMVFGKR